MNKLLKRIASLMNNNVAVVGKNSESVPQENLQNNLRKETFKQRIFKKFGKRAVIVWILYQTIKGTLTSVFIWAPLFYYHFMN